LHAHAAPLTVCRQLPAFVALFCAAEKLLRGKWAAQYKASGLFADFPQQAGMARCYASFEEKNRFDEERELKFALQRQMAA